MKHKTSEKLIGLPETGMKITAVLAFLILISALPAVAHADIYENIEDLKIDSLNCFIDGSPTPFNATLDKLWNPVQEAQQLPSRGPRIKMEWAPKNGSTESVFKCAFNLTGGRPWKGMAIEPNRPLKEIILTITDSKNKIHTFVLQNIKAARNKRFVSQDYIEAKNAIIELKLGCTDKCRLDLEEITFFAKIPEITYGIADKLNPYSTRTAFLPGDELFLIGGVNIRPFVCPGNRNYCSWTSEADCESHGFLSLDKDCEYDRCPRPGEYAGKSYFFNSQEFDSGRCASFMEKYFPQIIGLGITIWASIYCPGVCTEILFKTFLAIGSAISAYNPQVSFSDQWFAVASAFAMSYAGKAPSYASPKEAMIYIGVSMAASYATNWIMEELDLQFSGIIGSIISGAISAAINTAIQRAALAGIANGFDMEGGMMGEIAEMPAGEFISQGMGDMNSIFKEIVRASIQTAIFKITTEACKNFEDAERSICNVAALAGSHFLTEKLQPVLNDAFDGKRTTEINAVDGLSDAQLEGIKVNYEEYSDFKERNPDSTMTFKEFLKDREPGSGEFELPDDEKLNVIEGMYDRLDNKADFIQELEATNVAGQMLDLQHSTASMIYATQQAIRDIQDQERVADELGRQLEKNLGTSRCACYGQGTLLIDPQYLQRQTQCKSFRTSDNYINTMVPLTVGLPTGIPMAGFGWCRAPVESFYARQQEGGTVTAKILKDGNVLNETEDSIDESGRFAFSNITLPSESGIYLINLTSSTGATSTLFESMKATIKSLESLPAFPAGLRFALGLSRTTYDRLKDANLDDHAALMEGLKNVAEEIAAYNMPVSGKRDEINGGISEIENLMQSVDSLADSANVSGHITTLWKFKNDLDNTKEILQSALRSGSLATLTGINAADNLTRFRNEMAHVDYSFYNSRANNAEDKISNMNLYLTAGDFPYMWYSITNNGGGTPAENEAGIQELNQIPVEYGACGALFAAGLCRPYKSCTSGGSPIGHAGDKKECPAGGNTYIADIRLIDTINEFSTLSAGIVEYLRSGQALNISWNGNFPRQFLQDMERMKAFSEELKTRSSNIIEDVSAIHGTCTDEYGNPNKYNCHHFTLVYSPLFGHDASGRIQYGIATKESRQNAGRALMGAHVLANISELASGFYELAGDTAWHARLNNYPDFQKFENKITELNNALDELVGDAIELRSNDIEARASEANVKLDELKELTSDGLDASVLKQIEVMETSFTAEASPEIICSTGDSKMINATVKATAYWPVIDVQAGIWTPFSVPYISRQKLELRNIASQCNPKEIAWWDSGLQTDRRINADPGSVELVPGRGYYILSQNNCKIKFDLSLFKNSGQITFGDSEKKIYKNKPAFFGSGSAGMPLSPGSIGHIENEGLLQNINLGTNTYYPAPKCGPSRYEVYNDFYRERFIADNNWTEFRKAVPTLAYPFSNNLDDIRGRSVPANIMEPGNSYFAWTNDMQCNLTQLPASIPVSADIGIKGLNMNLTYQLPDEWKISDDIEHIFGRSENLLMPVCNSNYQYCAGIGDNTTFYRWITPKRKESRTYPLLINFRDNVTGKTASAQAEYNLVYPKPAIAVTAIKQGLTANYTAIIRSDIPQACGTHKFAIATEAPVGWKVAANKSVSLAPLQSATRKFSFSPIPGNAQSGFVNMIILSELSDSEKILNSDFYMPFQQCNPLDLITNALDIDANDAEVFYSTRTAINSVDKNSCMPRRITAGADIKGIDETNGKMFWIDGTDVKVLDSGNENSTIIAQAGADSFYIASDGNNAYWIEENKIMKAPASGGAKTAIADNLDEPLGIDVENGLVYWTEPKVIRKVSSSGNCYDGDLPSANQCAVAKQVPEALITESGRLASLDADGSDIFVSVINPNVNADYNIFAMNAPRNPGKVLRIGDSTDVIAKPVLETGEAGISSVAVDDEHAYFVRSPDVRIGGFTDRTSRFTQSGIYSDFLEVPGRKAPLVSIHPIQKNASAGTVAIFEINVTRNTADSLEPEQYYRITGFRSDDGLSLCIPDIFSFGYFRCEDDGLLREEILAFGYENAGKHLGPGESGTLDLIVKLNSNVTDMGKSFSFAADVAGIDLARMVSVNASVISDVPGPPALRGQALPNCRELDGGFINKDCSALYQIEIENPEQVDITYELSAIKPDVNWDVSFDRSMITVQGIYGINIDYALLEISPRSGTPYGTYIFKVKAGNKLFPQKFTEIPVVVIVTPDDSDGICEPEREETPENTRDCRNAFFTCAFKNSTECDSTNSNGVLFSAVTAASVSKLSVCEVDKTSSGSSDFASCKYYADKRSHGDDTFGVMRSNDQNKILCSADYSQGTTIPSCSHQCADKENGYMLLAKNNDEWKRSPAYIYHCPDCIGRVHSKLIETDSFFTTVLFPDYPEYSEGNVPFDVWTDYIAGEHLAADASDYIQYAACEALVSDAYLKAKAIIDEKKRAGNSIFPVDGTCSLLRRKAQELVNKTDAKIWDVCRNGRNANLVADTLSMENVSSGGTIAALNVTNGGLERVHAKLACNYEPLYGNGFKTMSSCESLDVREKKSLTAKMSEARDGYWYAECVLGWSPYDDCEAVVPSGLYSGSFDLSASEPDVKIEYALLPEFAYEGEETGIEVVASNAGGNANVLARCSGRVENSANQSVLLDGNLPSANQSVLFESNVTEIRTGSLSNIIAVYVPQKQGTINLHDCSLFTVGGNGEALADFRHVTGSIPVWSRCTLQCQRDGFSYGIQSNNTCSCGRLSFSNKACDRASVAGKYGQYNASVNVNQELGDEIIVNGARHSEPSFTYVQMFNGTGMHNLSASVIKNGNEIYRQGTSIACFTPPLIEIVSPENGGKVASDTELISRIADAGSASVYLNGNFINEFYVPEDGIIRMPMQLTSLQKGSNEIEIEACNDFSCNYASSMFTVLMNAFGGFVIDPSTATYSERPGSRFEARLKLTNGDRAELFAVNASLDKNWTSAVMIKGGSSARIERGEEADVTLQVDIPPDASLGDAARIFIQAGAANTRSAFGKVFGPYILMVSNMAGRPPFVLSLRHVPSTGMEEEPLTFESDIISEEPLTELSVCKNDDCKERWCSMNVSSDSKTGTYSCSIVPSRGTYSYALLARNSLGLQSITSERTFVVSDKKEECIPLAGKITADSMPTTPARNAVDGDIDTYWVSKRGLPQIFTIQMNDIEGVGGVEMYSESAAKPKSFRMETSMDCSMFDYNAFEDFDSSDGPDRFGTSGWYRQNFDARNAKCARIVAIASLNSNDYTSLGEIKFCKGVVKVEPSGNQTLSWNETCSESQIDCGGGGGILGWVIIIIIVIIAAASIIMISLREIKARYRTSSEVGR